MFPSLLAVLFWSFSGVSGSKAARLLGSLQASLWRLIIALFLLGAYAHLFGVGIGGPGFRSFILSGCIGFGLADTALYFAYPRIGSRLAMMLVHCLAAPFAACIEWVWLDVTLTGAQMVCSGVVLGGVAMALAPGGGATLHRPQLMSGVLLGVGASMGQALGAVLSRKAFAIGDVAGVAVDGLSSAYQRVIGGLAVVILVYLVMHWRRAQSPPAVVSPEALKEGRRWIILNAITGPGLGASCYQWALATTPSGIVLPIVSLTPLTMIPIAARLEGDIPTARSLIGGIIAVAGVVALHLVGK